MEALFNPDQCTGPAWQPAVRESTPQLEREQTAGMGEGDGDLTSYHWPQRKHPWFCCSAALQDKHEIFIAEHCHRIRISHFKS